MDEFTTSTLAQEAGLLKTTIVRIPQSVYRARPGMNRYRPDQATSVSNFFLCGDYTKQDYLASMEGAVISGKRVASRIAATNAGHKHTMKSKMEAMRIGV